MWRQDQTLGKGRGAGALAGGLLRNTKRQQQQQNSGAGWAGLLWVDGGRSLDYNDFSLKTQGAFFFLAGGSVVWLGWGVCHRPMGLETHTLQPALWPGAWRGTVW